MNTAELRFEHAAPKMKQVMTPFPFFLQTNATVSDARVMMETHSIHHLPIQRDGELVGIVSSRDLDRAAQTSTHILEVMRPDVLVVDMEQPLDGVLEIMLEERLGSALVRHGEKLAGIFTTFDACRLLARAFPPTRPPHSDDVA